MKKPGEIIRRSLLKRQEALKDFHERKEGFLLARKQIISDIEEARATWIKTLEKLPKQAFD